MNRQVWHYFDTHFMCNFKAIDGNAGHPIRYKHSDNDTFDFFVSLIG